MCSEGKVYDVPVYLLKKGSNVPNMIALRVIGAIDEKEAQNEAQQWAMRSFDKYLVDSGMPLLVDFNCFDVVCVD